MLILNIRHVTTYHYSQPVAFGEHRMLLLPRDDDDQKLLRSEIEITPRPAQLAWSRDTFGNHVATAAFAERAAELRFVSNIHIDHAAAGLYGLLVDMTQAIAETFRHVARHERGIQSPAATLRLGTGSCRDRAVLMIAMLRSRGIAARFVSGYLHLD